MPHCVACANLPGQLWFHPFFTKRRLHRRNNPVARVHRPSNSHWRLKRKRLLDAPLNPCNSYIGGCQGLHQMPRAASKVRWWYRRGHFAGHHGVLGAAAGSVTRQTNAQDCSATRQTNAENVSRVENRQGRYSLSLARSHIPDRTRP
jgi:hypothetical protein